MYYVYLLGIFQIVLCAIIISLGLWKWNTRDKSVQSNSQLLLYLSVSLWLLLNALEVISAGFDGKYLWGRLQYIPLLVLPIAWYYYSITYVGVYDQIQKLETAIIVFVASLLGLLAFTNDLHHFFWIDVTLKETSGIRYLDQTEGFAFYAFLLFVSLLVFSGIYNISKSLRMSGPMKSWQSTLLLVSAIAVFSTVIVDVSKMSFFPEPEISSIMLAFVIPVVGYTMDKLRYVDVLPAAHYLVFEHLEDGVVVISPNGMIIDMNTRAQSLATDVTRASQQQVTVNEAFPFLQKVDSLIDLGELETIAIPHGSRTILLDLSVVPIQDRRSNIQSYILLLRDVTEQSHRESTLLQRNKELEILNQITGFASSTHDLTRILDFIVELTCITLGSTSAYIVEVNKAEDRLTITAGFENPNSKHYSGTDKTTNCNYVISEVVPEIFDWLDQSDTYQISHVDANPEETINPILRDYLVQSILSVAIKIKGELYGFISVVESEKHRHFEASEIQLLQSIAHQIGGAIENAQLYTELTREVSDRATAEAQLRSSLKEKETLLKEVHHRVKNNLQVISSLLRLQLTSSNAPNISDLIRDSQSRIQSMALVHELLYQSEDLSTIDLGQYLEFLTHSLMASYQSQAQQIDIQTSCDSFDVNIETAITCGLLLNELVSNAIKHAFPTGEQGTVQVSIERGDTNINLIVQDNGVGLKEDHSEVHRNSLGLKLIDSFINQLDAKMSLTTGAGTRYEIKMPIPDS